MSMTVLRFIENFTLVVAKEKVERRNCLATSCPLLCKK